MSETEQGESILLEDEENDEEKKKNDLDYLDKYDLLQKDYDRYGSLISKPFGYDLFKSYKTRCSISSIGAGRLYFRSRRSLE